MSLPNDSRPGSENTSTATSKSANSAENTEPPPQGYGPKLSSGGGYFVMVPVSLFGRVTLRDIGVYAGVRSFGFGETSCSPTEMEVSQRLGVSVDTVQRGLTELRNAKVVKVTQRRGRPNVYTFPKCQGQQWVKVPVGLLGRVSPAQVGMYAALLTFQGKGGCFPKVTTVARRVGMGVTRTREMLRALGRAEVIEIVSRVRHDGINPTSNQYLFADLCQQTSEVPGQGHISWEVAADPGVGVPQIPEYRNRRSRCGTRTINQNPYPDLVGWSAPPARVRSQEPQSKLHPGTSRGHVAPGEPIAGAGMSDEEPGSDLPGELGSCAAEAGAPGNPGAPAPGKNPVSARASGWHRQPLADEHQERRAQVLVDLLAEGWVSLGRNKPAPETLENWLQTARIMLLGPDKRDYDQACQLITKTCRDEYWSGQVRSMYYLSTNWDVIAEEFSKREVRDVGAAARAAKRRKQRADKRVSQRQAESGSAHVSIGGFKLSDL